ncbi:MAG: mnmE [Gammaproteobacteria bacterium]|jgi:tRNA modification GTPase|nr:mnmE [Gammaproteobacteria bacterium]MCE3237675.1 mnmE [Gammaproteobacteria bacterium]
MQSTYDEPSDSIVALATPPGRGGVAIIRLSGKLVKKISENIVGKKIEPRYAVYTSFLDVDHTIIDQGIALYFPGPHSFTGEDVLELHAHGGSAIAACLIQRILNLGARLAKPGEFSERAFLNNKIDLIQAEAIADLIDASSEEAARAAMRSLQGEFSKKIHQLVDIITFLRTYVEAAIDFSEEEINFLSHPQIEINFNNAIELLKTIQTNARQGSLLQEGITAVIAGLPNVGKSSLLNRLSEKDIAIVTDIPGTTRDLLREKIIIDGMPIHIIDTAGLRESEDVIEQEGIRRAHAEIANADLLLFVTDASNNSTEINHNCFFEKIFKKVPPHAAIITIRNKIDLTQEKEELIKKNGYTEISLSAKSGSGIELLRNYIKMCVGLQTTQEGVFSARRRHLDALKRAADYLHNGLDQLKTHHAVELFAEELRQAQLALSEITGTFTTEDLLGKIFSTFCVGK